VKALVGKALNQPIYVDASSNKASSTPMTEDGTAIAHQIPQQLSQHVALVDSPYRLVALVAFLRQQIVTAARTGISTQATLLGGIGNGCRIVVFLATCASVDFHYSLLKLLADTKGGSSGVAAGLTDVVSMTAIMRNRLYKLHGEVPQQDRSRTFKDFCSASTGILLCTDVAARGLDMPNVDWIVQ
jgi:ATP-dependent RNA helicase DDX31/DBP7